MKRPIAIFLSLLLIFALAPTGFATESDDIWTLSVSGAHVNYDGYLVHVQPQTSARVLPLSYDGVQHIADELYLVHCLDKAQDIWQDSDLLYIERNYEIAPFEQVNDPLLSRQWALSFIAADALWAANRTGAGVRIAVVDSGITAHHEDIDPARIDAGFNYFHNNSNVIDRTGHGTRITGILTASRDNGVGIAGLLSEATIVPLKVFDTGASNVSVAIRAINNAVDVHRADVILLSWGITGGASSRALENAIGYAHSQGAIIVAAAGNSGTTTQIYPAAFDTVVSVGAVDARGNLASFSQRNRSVFVAAPGVNILTTDIATPSAYVYTNGTSYAAPFVAALAAIMLEENPNANSADFERLLRVSATPRGSAGRNNEFGHGIIHVPHFLAALEGEQFFVDISNHWARENIEILIDSGLMLGTSIGRFSPNTEMNRASFVTLLGRFYRASGGNVPARNDNFNDTRNNYWYSPYIAWAAEEGIVRGTPQNNFLPYDPISRQEVAAFLNRFAVYLSGETQSERSALDNFADNTQVARWAHDYLAWSIEHGIITGAPGPDGARLLLPQNQSTRAEVATMIVRFIDWKHAS